MISSCDCLSLISPVLFREENADPRLNYLRSLSRGLISMEKSSAGIYDNIIDRFVILSIEGDTVQNGIRFVFCQICVQRPRNNYILEINIKDT